MKIDTDKFGPLRDIFEQVDVNKDRGTSQQECINALEKLTLGLKYADIAAAFGLTQSTKTYHHIFVVLTQLFSQLRRIGILVDKDDLINYQLVIS